MTHTIKETIIKNNFYKKHKKNKPSLSMEIAITLLIIIIVGLIVGLVYVGAL